MDSVVWVPALVVFAITLTPLLNSLYVCFSVADDHRTHRIRFIVANLIPVVVGGPLLALVLIWDIDRIWVRLISIGLSLEIYGAFWLGLAPLMVMFVHHNHIRLLSTRGLPTFLRPRNNAPQNDPEPDQVVVLDVMPHLTGIFSLISGFVYQLAGVLPRWA